MVDVWDVGLARIVDPEYRWPVLLSVRLFGRLDPASAGKSGECVVEACDGVVEAGEKALKQFVGAL